MSDTLKQKLNAKYGAGKKYLRARDVCEYLGIAPSTVWYYTRTGKLTPIKISKRVTVFSIDEVQNLVNVDEVVQ